MSEMSRRDALTAPQDFCKRLFDIACSGLGLAALSPLFLVAAVLVKATSPGPVFFRQVRVGRNGRRFLVIKFRTMRMGAESGGPVTTAGDERVTPFGGLLRRYKLDEFPQLWNVFIGKMSLVGPRPDVPGYADRIEGEDRKILSLRPGITGPASLYFRDEEGLLAREDDPKAYNDTVLWPRKVALNVKYLETWGFWKDIGYILITVVPKLDGWFKLIDKKEYQ
jgi:lipopolysaccharide/colanic/teichoic acid biosynthesis glycosyltransferase